MKKVLPLPVVSAIVVERLIQKGVLSHHVVDCELRAGDTFEESVLILEEVPKQDSLSSGEGDETGKPGVLLELDPSAVGKPYPVN